MKGESGRGEGGRAWPGVIEAYRAYLPVSAKTPIVTLLEGNTPLIRSEVLSRRVGRGARVYLKYEGLNPTGSFKDRGMTVAISKAVEAKSLAGLRSIVLIPSGAIALGKLSQALIHNARVAAVDANFDACLALAKSLARQFPITLVNSINPYRIEGQKTVAFEICDALGKAPDVNCTPVGNAGNITAQWRGYREYHRRGKIRHLPVMAGFQAEGAAPLVKGRIIQKPRTIATAIRIGNPASWQGAIAAREESRGLIRAVSDREILSAYRLLARGAGVFPEPASAASVAGLLKLAATGYFKKARGRQGPLTIVCILTGHGLKDPERAIQSIRTPKPLPPSLSLISKAVGLK